MSKISWRAVLTDVHFWVPAIVLGFGIVLLVGLRLGV
ncbi:MAG TPA: translocated intimin receptor Tir [Terriglobia bacterium]|nr:translocated intimin receptor Tir [Terriglobia bacterium]